MVQHSKRISDLASVQVQREDSEWKYDKKSIAGSWFVNSKFSHQECAVSMRQWAANGEKPDDEKYQFQELA